MNRPISIENTEHYVWGNRCDGWHLLPGGDLSVIQERVPPGCGEVMHYHRMSRQFFFILEGEGSMWLEDEELRLHKGQGLEVLPDARHRFLHRSESDVIFLVISLPPSHGDRVDS